MVEITASQSKTLSLNGAGGKDVSDPIVAISPGLLILNVLI